MRHETRSRFGRDLTVPQVRAVLFLRREPESGLSRLADHLGISRPAASVLVNVLVRQGLAMRSPDPVERRRIRLSLTPEGTAIAVEARTAARGSVVGRARGAHARRSIDARGGDRHPRSPHRGPSMTAPLALVRTGVVPAIEAIGLTKRFGSTLAVDHLDLRVERWGLRPARSQRGGQDDDHQDADHAPAADRRRRQVAGFDVIAGPGHVRRRIGYVPQLAVGRRRADRVARTSTCRPGSTTCRARSATSRIADAIAFMGLDDAADRLVRTYSGGMIRRLEIAQAMLHRPPVLFLDEPTVGLDPTGRDAVWGQIRELRDRDRNDDPADHPLHGRGRRAMRPGRRDAPRPIAAIGTPTELKDAVGPGATLDDVFGPRPGQPVDTGGTYRDVARTRRTPAAWADGTGPPRLRVDTSRSLGASCARSVATRSRSRHGPSSRSSGSSSSAR